jgi:hypothetical protein
MFSYDATEPTAKEAVYAKRPSIFQAAARLAEAISGYEAARSSSAGWDDLNKNKLADAWMAPTVHREAQQHSGGW